MKLNFTPGPSQLFPTVKSHIQTALAKDVLSISHRGSEFKEIFRSTNEGLRKLLNIPQSHQIIFVSSGTQAMETILRNLTQESSTHFVNGAFSKRFYQTGLDLGKKSKKIDFQKQLPGVNDYKLPEEAELICFTQNETSTGVAIDPDLIVGFKKKYPQKLVAVDIVSSAPFVRLDWELIDVSFFSVQKLFGLPAGLAVIILSPQALDKSRQVEFVGTYNFPDLVNKANKFQTIETPNVLGLFLLDRVIKDLTKIGIGKIRRQTHRKAQLIYNFFDNHPKFKPVIKDPNFRSKTVIVVETNQETKRIVWSLAKKGIIVGEGYGEKKETQIRIANFPAHSIEDVERLLGQF